MEHKRVIPKKWMKGVLLLAAVVTLVSGIQYLVFPNLIFRLGNLPKVDYNFIWQSIGAADIIIAIVLLTAAFNVYKHWLAIFFVFLFKLSSSVIFVAHAISNEALWSLENYIFIDNLLWLLPLGAVLIGVYKHSFSADDLLIDLYSDGFSDFSLDLFETSHGDNLMDLSKEKPVMLLFLRHFGCTFCRESMRDIATVKEKIEEQGTQVVLVHMLEDEESAFEQIQKFGLEAIPTISDPECILYKMFKLRKGSFFQLYGPKVWARGFFAGVFKGLGLGKEMGDLNQMPGVFLLYNGEIQKEFIHNSAADRPNYLELATFQTSGQKQEQSRVSFK